MKAIQVEAYAKLNLYLRILDQRADGYHDIVTVLQSVSLCDELRFEKTTKDEFSTEVTGIKFHLDLDVSNLVIKAANRLKELKGWPGGVKIDLKKQIPVGAGLGGGSADAAATLVALNSLFELNLSDQQLHEIAISIGMDVPFFLKGGTVLATGRGEHLKPVNNRIRFYTVVVYPGHGISTRRAYQQYDKVTVKHSPSAENIITALETDDFVLLSRSLFNSFEQALLPAYRFINEIKQELKEAGAKATCLSGSGSAVFGIVANKEEGKQVQTRLANRFPFVRLVTPLSYSIKACPP